VVLRTATNLEALMSEHRAMVGFMLGEDESILACRDA
jgi:hypothetical protein